MKELATSITQLYPRYKSFKSISGIYLNEPIRSDKPIVYANFLSSMDGRIAVKGENHSSLPKYLTNEHDFRLFLELQAHTDCLVTHGAYLRARQAKQLGDILNIGKVPDHQDLQQWRRQQGLTDEYTLVICSKTLDFPEPDPCYRKNTIIAACEESPADSIEKWRNKGYLVVIAGEQMVSGGTLVELLQQRGHRAIFLAAGPKLLSSAIQDGCLDLLYLTLSHQFVATTQFHTLIEGIDADMRHCRLKQEQLIYDASAMLKYPQWYVKFQCEYQS